MTNPTAPTALPTTVTVPDGYRVTISAQTASRDYVATVVPGTYALEHTTTQYHPVADGERAYYVTARVQIDTPTRTQSSAEFGGVALASETIAGRRMDHTLVWYAYQVRDGAIGALKFA